MKGDLMRAEGPTATVPEKAGLAERLDDVVESAVASVAADLIAVAESYGLDRDGRYEIARLAVDGLRRRGKGPEVLARMASEEELDGRLQRLCEMVEAARS